MISLAAVYCHYIISLIDLVLYNILELHVNFKMLHFLKDIHIIIDKKNYGYIYLFIALIIISILFFAALSRNYYKKVIVMVQTERNTYYGKHIFYFIIIALFLFGVNTIRFVKESELEAEAGKINIIYENIFNAKIKYTASAEYKKTYADAHGFTGKNADKKYPYVKLSQTSYKPAKQYNIVYIFMESFGSKYVNRINAQYNCTPFFDSLSKKGLLFSRCYANGFQTPNGLLAGLCSTYPFFEDKLFVKRPGTSVLPVSTILKKYGYTTFYGIGSDLEYDNRRFIFKDRWKFDKIISRKDFPDTADQFGWGVHDKHMYEKALTEIKSLKEPFFCVLLTLSSHYPFDIPRDFLKKNKLNYDTCLDRFIASLHYADSALKYFFNEIQKQSFFKDTIFIITSDTGEDISNSRSYHSKRTSLTEAYHRIPLLFFTPDNYIKPGLNTTICSQVDICPSLIDILGINALTPWVGRSLFKKHADNFAYMRTCYDDMLSGIIYKNFKIIYNYKKEKYLVYDINDDFNEKLLIDYNNYLFINNIKTLLHSINNVYNSLLLEDRLWPREGEGYYIKNQ
ncbi:LTA synthase family protein [Spirochaetota bacterium]